ncbi:MAG: amidohydrolase family protein [Zavarzinella sp.]
MNSPGFNRRQMLSTSMQVVAGTGLLTQVATAQKVSRYRGPVIDAHSHIWTTDIKKYPLANGNTLKDLKPASFSREELQQVMKDHGIKKVVLIQHHPFHGWDNSYLTDSAVAFPEQFRVVGMVDDTSDKPAEQMKQLLKKHVTGFRVRPTPTRKDDWLEGKGMASMWECAVDTQQSICLLINPEHLPTVAKMCEKYPQTKVVIDHLARVGIDGTIREADIKALCDLAKYPKVHVKVSAFYALGNKKSPHSELADLIQAVLKAFGSRRLMWASDAPYQINDDNTYKASTELIQTGLPFLTATDKQDLLYRTANRVFFYV